MNADCSEILTILWNKLVEGNGGKGAELSHFGMDSVRLKAKGASHKLCTLTDKVVSDGGVCVVSHFSRVWLFVTPWTVAHQAPLSRGFSRQEYWTGLLCPPPGNFPDPGVELNISYSPTLACRFLTTSASWEALLMGLQVNNSDNGIHVHRNWTIH